MHEQLGKEYFGVETLTPEQYEEGKVRTFANLYGERSDDIEFFRKVREYVTQLDDGAVIHTKSGRKIVSAAIENATPAKVFNYLLQWLETQTAMSLILRSRQHFSGKSSKIVLYTYDSILIDFNLDDGPEFLRRVVTTLECGGSYPVRIYTGPNYNDLRNVTNTVKRK